MLGRVEPFELRRKNELELFNEVTVMFALYHLICFSDFVPDPSMRFSIGYSICTIMSIQLVVNMFLVLRNQFRESKFNFIVWWLSYKHGRQREARSKDMRERRVYRLALRSEKRK